MKKRKSKYTLGKFALRVRKSPTGKGLFAEEAFPKGACVIEYVGKKITEEQADADEGKYLFDTGKGTINGNIKKNTARYINHSCRPNCEADGPKGKVFILSLRAIKPNEELTYDYGKEYFDKYIKPVGCRCPKCTKRN